MFIRKLQKQDGFTLMELLTVIAIIGILAALIFPVIASSKMKAKQTQCMNNLNQIYTAVKMFQQDEHRYPDFIAGPVERDANGVIPLDRSSGMYGDRAVSLFPEYIRSAAALRCPLSISNGDRKDYTLTDAVPDPMYEYWQNPPAPSTATSSRAAGNNSAAFELYPYSSYDSQLPKYVDDQSQREVHYSPVWMYVDLRANPTYPETDTEYDRQLWWRVPPESTVITWCSFHREIKSDGSPKESSKDIVLFLDGHAILKPTRAILAVNGPGDTKWKNAWRIRPQ